MGSVDRDVVGVEFSKCPVCWTVFGHIDECECPTCHKSYEFLPDVDTELRIFIS